MDLQKTRKLGVAGLGALTLVLLAACSSSSSDSSSSAASSEAPAASSAAPMESSAAPAESSAAPAETSAAGGVVPGSGAGMKIGYISLGDSLPFVKIVSDSIKAAADEAGAELLFCDSQLDPAKALDCARSFKTQGVQGILNFQLDEKAAKQICEAGPDVPVIGIDIHQRPCEKAFMGANNQLAGEVAGEALGNFYKEKFNCEYDAFVKGEQPAAGEVTKIRADSVITGFEKICGPIPADKLRAVNLGSTTDDGRAAFADTLTALQGKKNIAVSSINDDTGLGVIAAAKAANRLDDIWLISQGADPTSWENIRTNDHWVGDSAYFPERYGSIGIPAIIKLINGEDPGDLLVKHEPVNRDNIDQIYPQ
jgi:ribose transport system substrate-binding protein